MTSRVGEFTEYKRAKLKGFRLVFNIKSTRWGGVTANLVETKDQQDIISGALYRITLAQLNLLTGYEGVEPTDVIVEAESVRLHAKAYIFHTTRQSSKPPDVYLNVITEGLMQHGYDEKDVEKIRNIAR
jgi:hypothetical protein